MATRRKKALPVEQSVELPPLPQFVWSTLGLVEIVMVEGLAGEDGKALCGQFDWGPRVIRIAKNLSPITAWQTLAHEHLHVVFYDAGIHLPDKVEERVCDSYGSFMTAFILGGGKFPFGDPLSD